MTSNTPKPALDLEWLKKLAQECVSHAEPATPEYARRQQAFEEFRAKASPSVFLAIIAELEAARRPSAEGRHPMFTAPNAWWAETGTAGQSEGCNRPFWLRHEAVEYVRQHGGYVKPLYAALQPPAPETCQTCNGRGEIGGWSGQTAESHYWDSEPCPDCSEPPAPETEEAEPLRAEILAIFKANKMASDERLAILIADRLAPRVSPPAPGYEGGWVMVPREPTREMWAAMGDAFYGHRNRHHDAVAQDFWTAALSKAPPPPKGYEGEAVAWTYEYTNHLRGDRAPGGWLRAVAFEPPTTARIKGGFARNVRALYAHPAHSLSREEIARIIWDEIFRHPRITFEKAGEYHHDNVELTWATARDFVDDAASRLCDALLNPNPQEGEGR